MFNSVQYSRSVVSDSLKPHESQHARPPCPSPTPGVHSNSCPSSQWCHPAISSSVVPFSSCPNPPSIRVFSNDSTLLMRWPKYWSFQPASVLPVNTQDWSPLGWTGCSPRNSQESSPTPQFQSIIFLHSPTLTSIPDHGKTIALTRRIFVGKVISLFFNMLSRLVITLLPRSKRLLISWLQSPSAVILEPPKIKSDTVSISTVSHSISHEVMGPDAMIFVFWMLSFKPTLSLSTFTFIKRLFSSSSLSAIKVVLSAYLRLLIFLPAILIPACASSSPDLSWCTLHIS